MGPRHLYNLVDKGICRAYVGLYLYKSLSTQVIISYTSRSTAGVVVSWKIPILSTRVRFPGGALIFFNWQHVIVLSSNSPLNMNCPRGRLMSMMAGILLEWLYGSNIRSGRAYSGCMENTDLDVGLRAVLKRPG